MEVKMIDIGKIKPSPFQTRGNFDEKDLKGLAKTYEKGGIIEILSVRPKDDGYFELISGERRLRAAKIAGLKQVPCMVNKVSNGNAGFQQLIANIQRKDLDPLGRAQAIDSLMEQRGWKTQREAAKEIGIHKRTISDWLAALKMPVDIQEKIEVTSISMEKIRIIGGLDSDKDKRIIFEKAVEEELPRERVFKIVAAFKEIDADKSFTVEEKEELKTEVMEAQEFVESPKSIIVKRKWEKEHPEKKNLQQSIGEFALKLAKQMGNVAKKLNDLAGSWEYLSKEGQKVILSHLDELNEIREKLEIGGKNG